MKKQVKQAIETISSAIQRAKINSELVNFLDDLLTEDEILDISQRLQISKLLNQGKTVEETAKLAKASTKTVSNINQILKYGKGGLKS
jgi:TrpR-related protein YerC/YecD